MSLARNQGESKPNLLQEIWTTNRHVVGILLSDAALFLLLVVLFLGFHKLIAFGFDDDAQRALVDKWHFRVTIGLWSLLVVSSIATLVVEIFRRLGREIRSLRAPDDAPVKR